MSASRGPLARRITLSLQTSRCAPLSFFPGPGASWEGLQGLGPISVSPSESPEQVAAFDVYLVGSAQECKVLRRLDFHPRAGAGRGRLCREVAVWCGLCPSLEGGLQASDLLSVSPSCERSARLSLLWERQPDSQPAVTGSTQKEAVSAALFPHSEPPTAKKDMDDSSEWLRSRDSRARWWHVAVGHRGLLWACPEWVCLY